MYLKIKADRFHNIVCFIFVLSLIYLLPITLS